MTERGFSRTPYRSLGLRLRTNLINMSAQSPSCHGRRMNKLKAVDLNLFKVLSEIYRQRNLTKVGRKIGMSQPAVSRSLERLNHLFGERLFVRTDGEMRPTRTTEMIIPLIEEALTSLETAVTSVSDFDPSLFQSRLKFGFNDYCMAVFFPGLNRLLKERDPNLNFTVLPANYIDAPTLLRQGEIDCAVVSGLNEVHSLDVKPLFEEDYSVIASNIFFDNHDSLSLKTYLDQEHILVSYVGQFSGWVDETLTKLGHKRKIGMSVHSFSAVPQVITDYPYLCAIPTRLANHYAKYYPIKVFPMPFESKVHTFYFVRSSHLSRNAISNWIRDQFVAASKTLN